jgi:LPS-assembly lipoprotein
MSWLRSSADFARLGRLVVLGSLLAACGFQPLYGDREETGLEAELAAIKVAPARERLGQMLVISLRDGLNPSGDRVAQRYSLTVTVTSSVGDFAIRADGTASRQLYAATASFFLSKTGSQGAVLTGSARANDSYDIGVNPFTTIVATGDADKKAAESMSQEIQRQIALFLRHQAKS